MFSKIVLLVYKFHLQRLVFLIFLWHCKILVKNRWFICYLNGSKEGHKALTDTSKTEKFVFEKKKKKSKFNMISMWLKPVLWIALTHWSKILDSVWCHFCTVNFFQNHHKRHPIVRQLGHFYSDSVTAKICSASCYIGSCYNSTQLYMFWKFMPSLV